jgi:hypothetical protein
MSPVTMRGINCASVLMAAATLLTPLCAAELDPIVIKVSAECRYTA